jgi:hypothetical protein
MAINASEVRVAGTGKVFMAPAKTSAGQPATLPTDATTAPGAGFVDLGYTTPDGVKMTFSRETSELDAWQGSSIRVLTSKEPKEITFTLMQQSTDTLVAAFGGGTVAVVAASGTAGSPGYKPAVATFTPPTKGTNTERALIVQYDDGAIHTRFLFARAQISGSVELSLNANGSVDLPLTWKVLDSTPPFSIISDDPAMVATTP